uniref:Uncharacterized protein n=1 Tax=Naja naja TaxID=35670 RepID=A0A8C6XLJ3_NAJNA
IYAMRNKLPREIHIRFTKKSIKSQILQAARDNTLKYNNKDITVLKQVPRRIRESRREYVPIQRIVEEGSKLQMVNTRRPSVCVAGTKT